MMTSRSRLIIDTNVLIDLHHGNVLDRLFRLPYLFIAPDVIIEELQELEVEQLFQHNANIAVTDLFALMLAASNSLPLLTGDCRLRKLTGKHNVKVHGTLWVLDQMVAHGILNPVEAARALEAMQEQGSRLPLAECQERLRFWEKP